MHEAVRRSPEALQQLDRFFRDGVIINPCSGRCAVEIPDGTPAG